MVDLLNKIPLVGHGKGFIHAAMGDEDRAREALMSANRSTLVVGGSLVAGPGGAIAGGAIADGFHSAVTGKNQGYIRDLEKMDRDLKKGRIPWEGSLDMAGRGTIDGITGYGIERRIVGTCLRPCLS